jgi:hypothetical protein
LGEAFLNIETEERNEIDQACHPFLEITRIMEECVAPAAERAKEASADLSNSRLSDHNRRYASPPGFAVNQYT